LLNPESGAAIDYALANARPFFLRHVRARVPVSQALCQVFGNAFAILVGLPWHLRCSHRRSRICICTRKNVTQEKSAQGRHHNSLHEGFFPLHRCWPAFPLPITTKRPLLRRIFARLSQWFADATNGIIDFFVRRGHFGRVNTDELCTTRSDGTEVCASGDQLAAILAETSAGAPQQGGNEAPASASASGLGIEADNSTTITATAVASSTSDIVSPSSTDEDADAPDGLSEAPASGSASGLGADTDGPRTTTPASEDIPDAETLSPSPTPEHATPELDAAYD
jgi:hypothetical protein